MELTWRPNIESALRTGKAARERGHRLRWIAVLRDKIKRGEAGSPDLGVIEVSRETAPGPGPVATK
jgi:hypothetical protein